MATKLEPSSRRQSLRESKKVKKNQHNDFNKNRKYIIYLLCKII